MVGIYSISLSPSDAHPPAFALAALVPFVPAFAAPALSAFVPPASACAVLASSGSMTARSNVVRVTRPPSRDSRRRRVGPWTRGSRRGGFGVLGIPRNAICTNARAPKTRSLEMLDLFTLQASSRVCPRGRGWVRRHGGGPRIRACRAGTTQGALHQGALPGPYQIHALCHAVMLGVSGVVISCPSLPCISLAPTAYSPPPSLRKNLRC